MVHRLQEQGEKILLPIIAFAACLVLSFVAGSLLLVPGSSKAVTGLGLVRDPSLSLDTSEKSLSAEVLPTSGGALAAVNHTLAVATDMPTGYSLALSTVATTLATTSGTMDAPAVLDNNTWGFALEGTGGFDATYAVPTPSGSSVWANPSAGATIKSTNEATSGEKMEVYYGVKADTSLAMGTYANTVRYTATGNVSAIAAPTIISVTPGSGTIEGGTAIQIVGTGFTVNGASITTAVTLDGTACTNVSISSNTPAMGQDTIYCVTQAHAEGAVDVAVTTWAGTATAAGGYTYVTPATVAFVSPNIASVFAGTESGSAFTIVGKDFTDASSVTIGGVFCADFTVVSDTQIFCRAANGGNAAGDNAVVVTKKSIDSNNDVMVGYDNEDYPVLQSEDAFAMCEHMPKLFRDERDSQLYYVKMMEDGKCWMVDNLKYADFGELHTESGKYLTADGTSTQSAANFDVAKYVDPGATDYCMGSTDIPSVTNTRCGLLYNWYAATLGGGSYGESIHGNQVLQSICPANFRLPTATSDGVTATSNGASYDAADFPVLNASMNAGAPTVGSAASYPAGWLPSGNWGGMLAGFWNTSLLGHGTDGIYWASTAASTLNAYAPRLTETYFSAASVGNKQLGAPVRCVMDVPLPDGIEADNLSDTNPAVIDVYPTTGWEGNTVAITSGGLFTDVMDVSVGGITCPKWGVINTSLVYCTLPPMTSGESYDVAVLVSGMNVTDASVYSHMKITYFDPNSTAVTVGGSTYNYYAHGFSSMECTALTASNAEIGYTSNSSMAYFRDTRNNQTYKVKKMADGKCWMVDNLKYVDSGIMNTADWTAGMVYNNGDHLNTGVTGSYNTVDGTATQSSANSDKAFYNNPMGDASCYSSAYMPAGTLTHCGFLYDWYAATGGTGAYAEDMDGVQVSSSICPANFRLPSGSSDSSSATANGSVYTAADFAVLSTSMNLGAPGTGLTTSSYISGWQRWGAWGGVFVGMWVTGLSNQGYAAYYWSSTANSDVAARNLIFTEKEVFPGNYAYSKYDGFAVRCVLR